MYVISTTKMSNVYGSFISVILFLNRRFFCFVLWLHYFTQYRWKLSKHILQRKSEFGGSVSTLFACMCDFVSLFLEKKKCSCESFCTDMLCFAVRMRLKICCYLRRS